jgi:hypothetical protein
MMSLSPWEQQALNLIRDRLAGSDPELAAQLSAFTRLTSGEGMPAAGRAPAGLRRALRQLRRVRRRSSLRRACQRLGLSRAALLLWLVTTAVLMAVALALSAGGHSAACTEAVAIACAGPGLAPAR